MKLLRVDRGDLVIGVSCGAGLNFALLQEAVGLDGRIIGVDLTDAMLDQARQRIALDAASEAMELDRSIFGRHRLLLPVRSLIISA